MNKKSAIKLGVFGVVCVSGALGCTQFNMTQAETPIPDLVLLNGNVLTVDAKDAVAQAVAISGNLIVAVGRDADVSSLAGPSTQRIDLRGRTVTPGLIDTHAHLAMGGIQDTLYINLAPPHANNIADVKRLVQERVAEAGSGEFIQGQGWDEGKLTERRYILARDLDTVSPNHPVYLSQTMGHYGVANSAALKLANITKDTPDPPGGTIDRLPDGSPSGILKERAQNLVRRLIPEATPAQVYKGITTTAQGFAKECMTGIKEPGIHQVQWDAYKKAQADGKLPIRVFALWRTPNTVEESKQLVSRIQASTKPYATTGDDHLISGGIKIGLDGSGGARTAWMHQDWSKDFTGTDTGNRGYPTMDLALAAELVKLYHNAGLHIGIHAIGDRAIDWTVDAFEQVEKTNPKHGLRHSIIHANVPTDYALDKMAMLQKTYDVGYPEAQGPFLWWLGDTYVANLGPERAPRLKPFKAYLDRGIVWGNGSDYPVTPYAGRYGLWSSVDRSTLLSTHGKRPAGTANSVNIHIALRSYTDWAARTIFLEEKVGTIEVGKYADLAVWDKNIYTASTDEIKNMQCAMTIFNGEIVHGA